MVHFDLFSGIGGFSLGLKRAGIPITRTLFSEIDKYAVSVPVIKAIAEKLNYKHMT